MTMTDSVDSWLVGERMRRTINFCLEVITDFDAGRISEETKGLAELLESVEQIASVPKRARAPRRPRGSCATRRSST